MALRVRTEEENGFQGMSQYMTKENMKAKVNGWDLSSSKTLKNYTVYEFSLTEWVDVTFLYILFFFSSLQSSVKRD